MLTLIFPCEGKPQATAINALAMADPLKLSTAQSFEVERMNRMIDSCSDVAELRKVAKQLLQVWMGQKAATAWVMRQGAMNGQWATPEDVAAAQQKRGPQPPHPFKP